MALRIGELLRLVENKTAFISLEAGLLQNGAVRTSLPQAAIPFFIAALLRQTRRSILVVTAQPERARNLYEQIALWLDNEGVWFFPEPDALPYQRLVSDSGTEVERLQALSALVGASGGVPLVVTSIPALLHKTTVAADFAAMFHRVKVGMVADPRQLLARWERLGYHRETIVEVPGSVAQRGGIMDIFPPTSSFPVRLEFMGNSIDSLRLFDPISQRSLRLTESITIGPATEVLAPFARDSVETEQVLQNISLEGCTAEICRQLAQEMELLVQKQRPYNLPFYAPLFNKDSLLSYLPADSLVVLDEPTLLAAAAAAFDTEAQELRAQRLAQGELPSTYPVPYFQWAEVANYLGKRTHLELVAFGTIQQANRLGFTAAPSIGGQLQSFIAQIKDWQKQKRRVILTSYQAARLEELLGEADIFAPAITEINHLPLPGTVVLVQGSLAGGWVLDDDTYLFTDAEIFGFVKQHRLSRKRPVARRKMYTDFVPGDFIVHVEHGIGKFAGVVNMGQGERQKEFLVLLYAAGDKLYVPTDQIDRVSRYIGAGDRPPVPTRLGTQDWSQTKKRVRESVERVAKDLLALYASREAEPGFAFGADTVWQREFEASFPYVETPDQVTAVQQVKLDMEKPRPMDRLVCGDVGYGKTEIAIRAAFKAVMDGKQVAVLVPTTILAQQHFITFGQRMEAFPIKIKMLSRLCTMKEQKATCTGLADGSIDICIGTHRLIQKDVKFKDLGLLIIDEEQRFGVAHKEYLKKMRRDVHVLTLTATPIPRTLHMALVAVRDMSTMETPPEDRLPIKTFVAEYSDRLVREGILKELERNGQCFFVHNRVQTIHQMAVKLRLLVPEARFAVGHGQMKEDELAQVMTGFINGESDVLVCSTIIESGLDIPNVNTMIVHHSDKFGLTQLYQLRGRIGRGNNLAYAYFLYDKGKELTATAEKRLRTIYEATELGAGFGIAMKDLEIRGAGTLLGMRQSGFISAVGFEMYSQLLGQAIEQLKANQASVSAPKGKLPKLPETTIDLPLPSFIPAYYIDDLDTRISLYQSLVKTENVEQLDRLAADMQDRFGVLPQEVKNLLYVVRLKLLASRAAIESILTEDGQVVVRRFSGMAFDQEKIRHLVRNGIKVGVTHLYLNPKLLVNWPRVLEEVVSEI